MGLFGPWPGTDKDEVLKKEIKTIFEWTLDSLPERRTKDLGNFSSTYLVRMYKGKKHRILLKLPSIDSLTSIAGGKSC